MRLGTAGHILAQPPLPCDIGDTVAGYGRRNGEVGRGSGRSKNSTLQLPGRRPEVGVKPIAGLGTWRRGSGSLEL